MLVLPAVAALAQPSIELQQGPTLLQPCLDIPACTEALSPPLSEALTEVGYALHHHGVGTQALVARGTGVVAEISAATMPLGRGNDIQEAFPSVPAIPRLSIGGVYGAGSREAPGPQLAAAIHGMPEIRIDTVSSWAIGASASAAVPVHWRVFVGGGMSWTHSGFEIPLIDSVSDLRELQGLGEYIERGKVQCAAPCVDRMVQHTVSAGIGAAVEPVPWALAYFRTGLLSQSERLTLALDRSMWRLSPVMLEASFGAGVRADDLWQLAIGATTAQRPAAASTERRWMTRLLLTTALRLGPRR